ncbi:18446_t:CDS:2, partial [Acaulospora morrowiae]
DELSNIAKKIQEITLNYAVTRPTAESGDRQPATRPRRNDKCFQCGKNVKHYEIEGDDDYEIEEYDKVYNTNVTRKVGRPLKRRIEHSNDGEAIEVLISHHGTESLLEPESDQESVETDLFDEFEYEKEKVDERDGYYTGNVFSDEELYENPWEEMESPAIYLTNVEEVPTLEGKKEPELTTKERIE